MCKSVREVLEEWQRSVKDTSPEEDLPYVIIGVDYAEGPSMQVDVTYPLTATIDLSQL